MNMDGTYNVRHARNDAFFYSRQTDDHLQYLAANLPYLTRDAARAELRRRVAL